MAMGQNPVPPVNIPIPTKVGSKMGGEFTYRDQNGTKTVLNHGQVGNFLFQSLSSQGPEEGRRFTRTWVLGVSRCSPDPKSLQEQAELAPHLALADLRLVEAIAFFEQPLGSLGRISGLELRWFGAVLLWVSAKPSTQVGVQVQCQTTNLQSTSLGGFRDLWRISALMSTNDFWGPS